MSNIYDKASLVLIPSGTKTSKVYSQKPTNGDGDFTFSRSTAATRVNASGNIEKETENLLTYSNTFSSWTPANAILTSGQSGYDGSSDAWLLNKAASAANIQLNVSSSGVNTFSYYAKAGSVDWTRLLILGSTNASTYINLTNGAIGVGGGGFIDATATNVGGGWYRVSITHSTAITQVRIYPAPADNDTSGSSGNIYIQDAQLDQGLVARDYIETTTTAIYGGITDNVPRLDYTDSSCPALLLEPQRTNLVTQAEYIGAWTGFGGIQTITDNYAISPEGIQNAARVELERSPSLSRIQLSATGTSNGVSCVFSVYLKANSGSPAVYLQAGPNVGTAIELTNEWQRYDLVGTASGGTTTCIIGTSDSVSGTTATADILVYGAQLESSASYATSYIPTYGSAVTRSYDYLPNKSGMQNFLGTDTGTWFFHINDMFFDITGTGVGSFILTYTGTELIEVIQDGNDQYKITLNNSNSVENLDGEDKVAISWSSAGLVIYVNGSSAYTTTSTAYSNPYSSITINKTTRPARVDLKQMMLFPTRLTNAELATLTTI